MLLILQAGKTWGQSANALIRSGNQLYLNKHYPDAEADYKKALSKDDHSAPGLFNLGNTLYRQNQFDEAYQQYKSSAKYFTDTSSRSQADYNMGNTFMNKKDWKHSISSFENALKLNPKDGDARYNLAYAEEMLKKKQGGGGKSQNKNKQNKNKNQNKKQNNKQNQNNQNKNQNKQNPQQQNQPQPSKLTKQEAQQLLNAAAQQEQKLQNQHQKNKKVMAVPSGKDW